MAFKQALQQACRRLVQPHERQLLPAQPAVVMYGRRWHTATDTIPFPGFFAAILHAVWIIVFGWLISVYDIWTTPCHGQGVHYKVVSGGLAAVYGLSFLTEAALTGLGLRGRLHWLNDLPGTCATNGDVQLRIFTLR